ncbi:MAG: InlB B-repeat-containing protein [Prevotella sp.]|nr:InlB B-repeat-containing protein [Prevotella sp.]
MKKQLFTLLTLLVTIVTGAWADPVTIGLTQSVTDEGNTHTVGEPAYNGTTNLTVSKSIGSSCGDGYTGKTVKVGSPEVTYTVSKAFRKTIKGTSFDDNQYVGYTFTVASGYKVSLTNLNAEFWSSDATMYWRVVVINNSTSTTLYTSSTVQNNNNNKGSISVASPTGLTDLTEGTYTVKLQMYQNGGNKYFVVPTLTFSTTLTADDTPSYTMTATVDNATHGTVEVSAASVKLGGNSTFTATSKTGYKFTKWTDTNTGNDVSTDNPYTISNVSENVSLTANFANAYSISYNVTDGNKGTTTKGLSTDYANDNNKFTAPQNYYIFKDGYTLTSWTDGINNYIPGIEYTLTENIVLQPVFTPNAKTLGDRTATTSITWNFNYVGGEAPLINVESATGYYIKQAIIDGISTDIVMAIDNTTGSAIAGVHGKTNNEYNKETQSNRTYAQVNRGSKWTIPAVKGMTVVAYSANGNYLDADDKTDTDETKWKYATTVGGVVATSGTGTQTATWVYNGEDATIDYVAGNDAGYVSKLVVTYPAPYSVTYDGNGAESGSVTDEEKYDKNAFVTTKSNSFVKTGYAFVGWNTEADGTGTTVAAGSEFSISGNTTLYAQWAEGVGETITYVVKTTSDASTTESTHLTNLVNETNVGIDDVTDQSKTDRSGKYATSSTEGCGVNFSFDIAEGYTFRPTSISMQLATVSTTDFTFQVTLTDSKGTKLTSNALNSFSKDGVLTNVTFPAYDKTFAAGTVNMLVTAVRQDNAAGMYRIGKTITISGVVNTDIPSSVSATITPTGYATFSSPYALDFSNQIDNLDGAYYASAVETGKVTMTKLEQTVPAETGIFLKGTPNGTVTIPVVASGIVVPTNYLKPNTSESTVAKSTENAYHYVFAYTTSDNSNPGFFNLASPVTLGAGKAYLETTTDIKPAQSQGAKVSILFFDDNLTGIQSIDASSNVNANADKMYNLGGQLVGEGYKGIVIVNGKKVIK